MADRTLFHSSYLRILDGVLADRGLALPPITAEGTDAAALVSLVETIRATCPDPALAIEWGEAISGASHGLEGTAILSAPDMETALVTLARLLSPRSGAVAEGRIRHHGRDTILEIHRVAGTGETQAFFTAGIAVLAAGLMRGLIGQKVRDLLFELPLDRAWADYLDPALPGTIRYSSRWFRLIVPHSLMSRTPLLADAVQHVAAMKEVNARRAVDSVSARVRLALADCDSLSGIATRLNMSERSLRRALAGEGTSFRKLMDENRITCAHRFLADPTLSVEEVASRAGYSEASNFIRAFKRVSGMTPHQWRKMVTSSTSADHRN